MSYMSELDIKRQNEMINTNEESLIKVLNAIGDWFANHPQAAEDCKRYVETNNVLTDQEHDILGNVFGEDDEFDLPDEVIVPVEELNVENWEDEEEVDIVLGDYLSNVFGYCVNSFLWDYDTKDSGDIQEIIIKNIDWDTKD